MKKIYLTLGLSALLFGASAQQFKIAQNRKAILSNFHGLAKTQGTTTIDTLVPASIADSACGAHLSWYVWDNVAPYDSGYIFGTGIFPASGYTITAVAQKYKVTGAATVTDVLVLTPVAHGGTVTTTANIYSDNSSHKPNTVLGTSNPLAMSVLTTTALNTYHFATPVALTAGSFYASVNLPAFGGTDKDTLVVLGTQQGCSSIDSLSLVKLNANTWLYTRSLFGHVQQYDLDLFITPVIDISTAGINFVTKGGLSLYAAYPNPANTIININFSLDKASKVDVEIYDISGKIVKTISNNNTFVSGTNLIGVDVSNLEAGSYLYSIHAGGTKMFSRFVVTK